MCYSTRQTRTREAIQQKLRLTSAFKDGGANLELIHYHANGWEHPLLWIVAQEYPKHLLPAMWGLMPAREKQANYKEYFKNPKTFGGLNAKSEKLFDHFIYRYSWQQQRCVIPIDGFFEPHNTKVKVKGKDFKVPFYFYRKDGEPLYLAGIYTQTADERWTFAVLTKAATPKFAAVHNDKKRRPILIAENDIDAWLHDGNTASDVQDIMDNDLWEGELGIHPVTKDLYSRSVVSNYPGIIEKVDYPEVQLAFD
ncbi:Hypothetical protein I595_1544 [Croceitalea dokdonensis DOKDO 023]|uniref:Abasic site processing protein n=1 Tax=Croceitalea dokdonensis DOKDO 023 TaxID=1300341 RepID=A0A0P7AJB7_9FLAO|nr:SOS response-associated peptidase family protein [Croceitalea dokdonensis]KPM31896.1 Hypothetical protein I595_1544 [Croceitalea dokdonensis DOKDO 023]